MKVKSNSGYLDREKLEHPFVSRVVQRQRASMCAAAKEVGEEVAEIKMYEVSRRGLGLSPLCFCVRKECLAFPRAMFLARPRF